MAGGRTKVLPSASVEHACCQGVLLYLWERRRDTAVSSDVGPINDRLVGLLSDRYTVPWYSSLIWERFRKMGVGSRIHMLRVSVGGKLGLTPEEHIPVSGETAAGRWLQLGETHGRDDRKKSGPESVRP